MTLFIAFLLLADMDASFWGYLGAIAVWGVHACYHWSR
jgi:hypothetical protein